MQQQQQLTFRTVDLPTLRNDLSTRSTKRWVNIIQNSLPSMSRWIDREREYDWDVAKIITDFYPLGDVIRLYLHMLRTRSPAQRALVTSLAKPLLKNYKSDLPYYTGLKREMKDAIDNDAAILEEIVNSGMYIQEDDSDESGPSTRESLASRLAKMDCMEADNLRKGVQESVAHWQKFMKDAAPQPGDLRLLGSLDPEALLNLYQAFAASSNSEAPKFILPYFLAYEYGADTTPGWKDWTETSRIYEDDLSSESGEKFSRFDNEQTLRSEIRHLLKNQSLSVRSATRNYETVRQEELSRDLLSLKHPTDVSVLVKWKTIIESSNESTSPARAPIMDYYTPLSVVTLYGWFATSGLNSLVEFITDQAVATISNVEKTEPFKRWMRSPTTSPEEKDQCVSYLEEVRRLLKLSGGPTKRSRVGCEY